MSRLAPPGPRPDDRIFEPPPVLPSGPRRRLLPKNFWAPYTRFLMALPDHVRGVALVPAIIVPALIVLAQLAIWATTQIFGSYDFVVELVPGVPYRVEPLLTVAIAIILGLHLVLYADLGIAQAGVAMVCLVAIQLAARYAIVYAIAVYVPVGVSSVEQYSAELLSFQATADGICCLIVLSICANSFRLISIWLVVLACWSASTILFAWGRWDTIVATLYPYVSPVATVIGYGVIGRQFGRVVHHR